MNVMDDDITKEEAKERQQGDRIKGEGTGTGGRKERRGRI